jgi:hypothetical protein
MRSNQAVSGTQRRRRVRGRLPRRVARRAAAGAQHEGADHDRSGRAHLARTGGAGAARDSPSCPNQGPYHCHPPMAVADGSPPDLSPVADCGLGADLAGTALLKRMTGGWPSGGSSWERGEGRRPAPGWSWSWHPLRAAHSSDRPSRPRRRCWRRRKRRAGVCGPSQAWPHRRARVRGPARAPRPAPPPAPAQVHGSAQVRGWLGFRFGLRFRRTVSVVVQAPDCHVVAALAFGLGQARAIGSLMVVSDVPSSYSTTHIWPRPLRRCARYSLPGATQGIHHEIRRNQPHCKQIDRFRRVTRCAQPCLAKALELAIDDVCKYALWYQ